MKSRVKTEESVSSKRSALPAGAHRDGLDQPAMFPPVGSHVKMEESASSMNMTTMPVIAQPDGVDEPAVMMSRNVTQDTLLLTITTNTLSATTMEIVKIYQGATSASVT